jgi:hypothetical protein
MSARGNALLQLSKPVEHDLNLRSGGCAGRGVLSYRDDAEESLTVRRENEIAEFRFQISDNFRLQIGLQIDVTMC